ncbi:MAG TPA: hypothetical protein PK364_01890 [Synergistaceae bacterium]|nr:hypothetical protein [Synergistaceae bacterium]HPJ25029.1 hypothetical protein [Synergistaceae bacterium]HPQ36686.1 hypothetical protein [Synergistaceae bacterium]
MAKMGTYNVRGFSVFAPENSCDVALKALERNPLGAAALLFAGCR